MIYEIRNEDCYNTVNLKHLCRMHYSIQSDNDGGYQLHLYFLGSNYLCAYFPNYGAMIKEYTKICEAVNKLNE